MKVGIDLGGSHIALGLIDGERIIEEEGMRLQSEEKANLKQNIEAYIINNINKWKEKYQIESVGLAVPGTICDGVILKSVNLGINGQYDLRKILETNLNLPITLRNDAKCAALAENKMGCLKDYSRSIFLTLGTGIGGAVIIDSKLLNTGKYSGSEFGHMIIERNGRKCNCGNKGCFETYASMKVLKRNLKDELGLPQETRGEELLHILRKKQGEEPLQNLSETQGEGILYNLQETDEYESVSDFIDALAMGIANLVNIFEPEAIGIGGSFVFFQDVLLPKLVKHIKEKSLLFNPREELKIFPAMLGNDAGLIGATL